MADHDTHDHTGVPGVGIANPLATDSLWDAAGDLVQGTGANAAAKLGAGLAGQALISAGAAAANAWKYPPGYEFDYAQITSNASITATTEATANTVVSGNAVTYDGSTIVLIHAFAPLVAPGTGAVWIRFQLYDGSSSIADTWGYWQPASPPEYVPVNLFRRLTPSNASHTYSLRAYQANSNTGTVFAGAGGSGNVVPAFIRITKV